MNSNLVAYIKRYIDITNGELAVFQSYLSEKSISKKEFLLKEGEVCNARYYIVKGCLRVFYLDKKGNEQIIHFGVENWWMTDYDSLINQRPSHLNIQAVQDTTLLMLQRQDLEELFRKLPKIERFFRIILEKAYIAAQRRTEYMYSLSAEEMYDTFHTANPTFAQEVPQYMIASYLGITPEVLSKIRAKKK